MPEKPEALSREWPAIWDSEDDDDFAEVQKRPAPPRPGDLPASWKEVPLSGSDWIDADGGFWQEPEAERDARWQIGCDKREGRCGLAGGTL